MICDVVRHYSNSGNEVFTSALERPQRRWTLDKHFGEDVSKFVVAGLINNIKYMSESIHSNTQYMIDDIYSIRFER